MADGVFNIAKGAAAEKFRDAAANGGLLLLKANETETDLVDHADLAALIGAVGNTESSDGSYARKTGLTGVVTVDNSNDRVDIAFSDGDQTWIGLTGETFTKAVVFYEEAAADANRIPLTHHDFPVTSDGSDITLQWNAAGFYRAS